MRTGGGAQFERWCTQHGENFCDAINIEVGVWYTIIQQVKSKGRKV